jgi:2-keto-4-pentenoate hydratase
VYTQTQAVSMIVENCWNGGVVVGTPKPVAPRDVTGVSGRQTLNGKPIGEGKAEDPYATLAWLANLLAERGRDLQAGMVVITGSLIPTFSIHAGDRVVFSVEGLGDAVLEVV